MGAAIVVEPENDLEEAVSLQGCLRRKTVLKDGRKPAVAAWQRYWVQLWTTALVFYLPKSFKGYVIFLFYNGFLQFYMQFFYYNSHY